MDIRLYPYALIVFLGFFSIWVNAAPVMYVPTGGCKRQ